MVSLMKSDDEFSRLRAENRVLVEDLRHCQNDKDFVWSLWKKLQVANPDVTKAVSLVVQREKEKAEIKDRKVLEVLQMKDDKIEELQTLLALRSKELSEVALLRLDNQENLSKFQHEIDQLRDKNSALEMQLRAQGVPFTPPRFSGEPVTLSQFSGESFAPPRFSWKMKGLETRERSLDDLNKNTVESLTKDKFDLEQRLRKFSTELEIAKAEKESSIAQRISLENKVKILEKDVTENLAKFEGIIIELEEAKRLLQQYDTKTLNLNKEIEFKNRELETVRKELSELWHSHNQLTDHSSQQADLIRQLQSLQHDTQKMLKNQEDAYTIEASSLQDMYKDLTARYENAKKSESELRQELHNVRKEVIDKDGIISSLQSRVDAYHKRQRSRSPGASGSFITENESLVDQEFRINTMQREINLLNEKLQEKDRYINQLENLDIDFDVSRLNKRERTHSTPAREVRSVGLSPMKSVGRSDTSRSRSLSPVRKLKDNLATRQQGDLRHKLVQAERKLEDTKNVLKLKNRELEELRKAHAKRLDRLKSVQTDYKIVKDQLRLYEDDTAANRRGRQKKRSNPKDLRQESSDKVWNELAFFKNENRNLVVERMSLEEELDMLKVQATQDAATIHEFKVALEQEKEDRQYERKKTNIQSQERSDLQSELMLVKSQVQSKTIQLEKVEKELREAKVDKEDVQEDKRSLKSEILELKQNDSKQRMEIANLKRDVNRLERELCEEKVIKEALQTREKLSSNKATSKAGVKVRRVDTKNKSRVAKQYQTALNKSIEKMKSVFRDFEDEGWEEVQESVEDTEESDSLGDAIVDMSHSHVLASDDSSTPTSTLKHRLRPQSFKPSSIRSRRAAVRTGQNRFRSLFKSSSNSSARDMPPTSSSSNQARTVVMRETGTSPISSPIKDRSPSSRIQEQRAYEQRVQANNRTTRQLNHVKQRLGYMQQQIASLKDSRNTAIKALNEQKEANQQITGDLNLANQRLRLAKQNMQKLTGDLDKALQEKGHLEAQVTDENRYSTAQDKHTEQDWKILESRLKASSNEVCRQSGQARQLKQDNEQLQEQIRNLQDRINRIERDNNQKRALLEDQRVKLKLAQTNTKSEQNANEEMETRLKLVQDTADRYKVQIESLKKRLSAVTRERREYEERFLKSTNELEKKNKLFVESQTRRVELESAVGDLEKTAQQQLRGLASQSEAAIEDAQKKLGDAYYIIQQYQQFVKSLGHELIKRICHSRVQLKDVISHRDKEISQSQANASLQKAQAMAKNILNISQSDLDEIMSADGDSDRMTDDDYSADKKRDRRWSKKCEKLLNSKEDFVHPLVDLFIQKIEERCELVSKLQTA